MKKKIIIFSCAIGLGLTTLVYAEIRFVDLSTPNEEIEKSLELKSNDSHVESKSLTIESKTFADEGKGYNDIIADTPVSVLNDKPKVAVKVHFDKDSDEIHPDDSAILRKLSSIFQGEKLSGAKIVIAGHTDSDGDEIYNKGLSYNRALSVKNFLVSEGVSENVLAIKAFGEESPIASNESNEGKSQNRRVEFIRME